MSETGKFYIIFKKDLEAEVAEELIDESFKDVIRVISLDLSINYCEDMSEFCAGRAHDFYCSNATEDDLEDLPPILLDHFPFAEGEIRDAIAEREALRKSDETAYEHYVK